MNTLITLFWADSLATQRWFSVKTISRVIVSLLFLLTFSGVAAGLFGASQLFFTNLAAFETYGQLTAHYVIHAALIIILWLAISSSVTAAVSMVLSLNPSLSLLLTLPIQQRTITTWLFVKTIFANLLLMLFVFLPITIAYAQAFQLFNVSFLLGSATVISCVVVLSAGIGMPVALLLTHWLRGKEYIGGLIGLAVFFLGMIGLLKLIFPPGMSTLHRATDTAFMQQFSALPLNNEFLPTYWFAQALTVGFQALTIYMIIGIAVFTWLSLWFQSRRFVTTLQIEQSRPHTSRPTARWQTVLLQTKHPFMIKDLLSILRSPSELGYGIFLVTIASFFFLFLSLATKGAYFRPDWEIQLIRFSFGWLLFFSTALALRFVFPLMAREGKSAWYVFSLPISRMTVLIAKLRLSFLISSPIFVLAVVVWWWLPFATTHRFSIIGLSVITAFCLVSWQVLLGAIQPNFKQGNDVDKLSTSSMGLITVLLSALGITAVSYLIDPIITNKLQPLLTLLALIQAGLASIITLWLIARSSMRHYQW